MVFLQDSTAGLDGSEDAVGDAAGFHGCQKLAGGSLVPQPNRELGVCYALEGSVRRKGNQVLITAQLVVKVRRTAEVVSEDWL